MIYRSQNLKDDDCRALFPMVAIDLCKSDHLKTDIVENKEHILYIAFTEEDEPPMFIINYNGIQYTWHIIYDGEGCDYRYSQFTIHVEQQRLNAKDQHNYTYEAVYSYPLADSAEALDFMKDIFKNIENAKFNPTPANMQDLQIISEYVDLCKNLVFIQKSSSNYDIFSTPQNGRKPFIPFGYMKNDDDCKSYDYLNKCTVNNQEGLLYIVFYKDHLSFIINYQNIQHNWQISISNTGSNAKVNIIRCRCQPGDTKYIVNDNDIKSAYSYKLTNIIEAIKYLDMPLYKK